MYAVQHHGDELCSDLNCTNLEVAELLFWARFSDQSGRVVIANVVGVCERMIFYGNDDTSAEHETNEQ